MVTKSPSITAPRPLSAASATATVPVNPQLLGVTFTAQAGAFTFRNAVEFVSDAMGVSRATLYNYLNAHRDGNA